MKSPPAEIKKPAARLESQSGQPKEKLDVHNSANGHSDTWSIPPDDRAGLEVTIGGMGHVVLTQQQPFMDASAIVLHPVEAGALVEILPLAIAAANEHRRGAV